MDKVRRLWESAVRARPLLIRHHGKPCAPLCVQKELRISRLVSGINKIGVGGANLFHDGSATDLPSLAYFRSKRFFGFFAVFSHKSGIDLSTAISTCLLHCEPARVG